MNKLNKRDLAVLNRYAELLPKYPIDAMKRAIMEVYEYKPDDPWLPSKIYNKRKRLVQTDKIAELFAAHGIDKIKVASKLVQLMDAKKLISLKGIPTEVPDNTTQLNTVKLAADILGLIQKHDTVDIARQQNNLIVLIEDEASARKRVERARPNEIIAKSYQIEEASQQNHIPD